MGLFANIPVRANGQKFYYTWFNSLRTAGIALENFLGGGALTETSFTLANNQVAAANVTGLTWDKATYKSAHIECEVRRKTDSSEVISNGRLIIQYRDATAVWEILDELSGDDDGVTFTVTTSSGVAQIQYASDNMSGSNYSGTIKFRATTFNA